MRIITIEADNLNTCGICQVQGHWVKKVNVRGIEGLYCFKCNTLTMKHKMPSKYVYRAFKDEIEKLMLEYRKER